MTNMRAAKPGPSPVTGAVRVDLGLLRALAGGYTARAAQLWVHRLHHAPADGAPAVDALIEAELATRRGESTVGGLIELAAHVGATAGDAPVLRWWAGALMAERCGVDLDLAGASRAVAVLDDLPNDPLAPVLVLWVRGRLRRVASLARLFGSHPDLAGSRHLRALAIADLSRGGFPEEVAATRMLGAAGEAVWLTEDVERNLVAAADARAMVGEDSAWAALLDAVLVVTAIAAGDWVRADQVLRARAGSPPPYTLGAAFPLFRAWCDLAAGTDTGSTAQAFAATAVQLRGADPLGSYRVRLAAATALMDTGHEALARGLALQVLDMPPLDEIDGLEKEALRLRFELHAGAEVPLEAMTTIVDRFTVLGHSARAAAIGQRLAGDLERTSRDDHAQALRRSLPALPRRRGAAAHLHEPTVRVRVMAPTVTVEVDGQDRELPTTAARLLLTLLLAHPEPLAAETAAAALWPTRTWDGERRRRLNTVVHRLRQSLANAAGAVRRVNDMLALAVDGWDVDLFRLRRALGHDPSDRYDEPPLERTLAGMTGSLAHVQFPYDEQLIDERRALAGAIVRRLHTWTDAEATWATTHAEALRALGALPP